MAWIYLRESEDSPSDSAHGSDPSLTVKTTDTLKQFFCRGWQKDCCPLRPSGTTFERFLPSTLKVRSISSAAAFRVRTSASQEMVAVWKESRVDFSSRSLGLPMHFDLPTYSWRTSQLLLFGGWSVFSESFPQEGMIADGRCYPLARLVPITEETVGGVWPTPTKRDWKDGSKKSCQNVPSNRLLGREVHQHPMTEYCQDGGKLNPRWVEWLMGYHGGFTELSALGMQWFRPKQNKPLKN